MGLRLQHNEKYMYECGVDEAGAGPLMGPVVAAAVIWKTDCPYLMDSKKLTSKKINELATFIKENAEDWAVAFVDEREIEKINILQARIKAMHKAIGQLKLIDFIDMLLIDGNRFNNYEDIPYTMIVKGDNTYQSIAAASILAKQARDEYVEKLHDEYPVYNWEKNKGYGTKEHRDALVKHGATIHHRKTFLTRILD